MQRGDPHSPTVCAPTSGESVCHATLKIQAVPLPPEFPPPVFLDGQYEKIVAPAKPALDMRHERIVVMHPVRLPCKAAGSKDVPGR